jgi:hypothetical protein
VVHWTRVLIVVSMIQFIFIPQISLELTGSTMTTGTAKSDDRHTMGVWRK